MMKYRKLGKSDLEISVVALGTWVTGGWWWGGSSKRESIGAIQKAIDSGINFIDTAPAYGFGRSEQIVGKAIKGKRDDVLIATKCGLRWDSTVGKFHFESVDQDGITRKVYRNLRADSIRTECEQSLKRLDIERIDLYQCHWPDPTTPVADTMEEFTRLKEEGKIRYFGVSNFTASMMSDCLKTARLTSDQPKYSMLSRKAEKDVLPFARKNSVGVICYSPLEQGILTGAVTLDREFPETDGRRNQPWFRKHNLEKALVFLDKIRPIADAHNCTPAQLALAWIIAQDGVTSVIAGGRRSEQVEENAQAGDIELTSEELTTIRGHLDALGAPQ